MYRDLTSPISSVSWLLHSDINIWPLSGGVLVVGLVPLMLTLSKLQTSLQVKQTRIICDSNCERDIEILLCRMCPGRCPRRRTGWWLETYYVTRIIQSLFHRRGISRSFYVEWVVDWVSVSQSPVCTTYKTQPLCIPWLSGKPFIVTIPSPFSDPPPPQWTQCGVPNRTQP